MAIDASLVHFAAPASGSLIGLDAGSSLPRWSLAMAVRREEKSSVFEIAVSSVRGGDARRWSPSSEVPERERLLRPLGSGQERKEKGVVCL